MSALRFRRRPVRRRPAASWLAYAGLLLAAACYSDRPTEPGPASEPALTTTSTVDCANGCMDTFTGEGTSLAAHTPDVGGFTWRNIDFGIYDAVIRSNAVNVEGADTLPNQFSYQIPETLVDDTVEIEVEVFGPMPLVGTYTPFITLRGNGGGGISAPHIGYHVYLEVSGGRTWVGFQRSEARIPADHPGQEIPHLTAGVHKFRAVSNGGTLQAYLNGVLVNSVTDTAPLPPGNPGFGLAVYAAPSPFGSELRVTSFTAKPGTAPAEPKLEVRCTPSTVERGQDVTCAANLPTNWNVTRWEFTANDEQTTSATATGSADDGVALSAGLASASAATISWDSESTEWVGPAATGGVVTVHVTDADGNPQTSNANFTVTDRGSTWQSTWKYRRGTTAPQKLTVPDHEPVPGQDTYGQNCPEQSCLLVRRLHPDPVDSAFRTFTPVHVTTGPNLGVWFVGAAHYDMERVANLNPSILPTGTRLHPVPLPSATNTCRQGLGAGPKAKTANANWWQFNNYCGGDPFISTGRNMTDFIDGIWAHEEFGRNGGSGHESLARAEAAKPENDPYLAIEGLYAFDSLTLASLVDQKAIPISNRITSASADPKPTGNLPASGWLWFWTLNQKGRLQWLGFTMESGL